MRKGTVKRARTLFEEALPNAQALAELEPQSADFQRGLSVSRWTGWADYLRRTKTPRQAPFLHKECVHSERSHLLGEATWNSELPPVVADLERGWRDSISTASHKLLTFQ